MDRRQMASVWCAGAVSALALAVLVGVSVSPRQEGKEARQAREAEAEQAERTVVYDPQNYLGFDPQAFYVPPKVIEVRVEERHALQDCAMEYAPSVSEATDAVLFADPGQRIGLGPVFGDRGFHVHVIAGGKDRVFRPDDRGNLALEAEAAPARVVLVTTPFTIEYPDARVFIPPYTMSMRVLPADQLQGMVAAQPFARAVKPTENAAADLFVATMPRSDSEFVFAAYDLSGKRGDLETGLWLGSGDRYILQPTFRAWVEDGGRVTQKVELLPFPPTAGFAAAGTEMFKVESPAGAIAEISVPPRPHVDMPDTSVEPLPAVTVTATFYGFPKGSPFRVVTGQGFARPGRPSVSVDHKEHAQELTYQVTSMQAERDAGGRPIPRTAFYSLRVSRKWDKEAGCAGASFVTAFPPRPLGDRVPFVPTTKLLHAKIVRLGGAGSASSAATGYNPLFAGVMADGMVRAALGLREVARPSKAKGAGTQVVVNNYINTEGGLGGGGTGLYFAAAGSRDADWMGRWATERYQQELQQAGSAGGAGGSNLMGRGWNGMPR
jgi:heme exporter protein D